MNIVKPLLISVLLTATLPGFLPEGHAVGIPTDISLKDKPATIKVLVGKNLDKALLEVKGRHFVYDPSNSYQISQGSTSKRAFITPGTSGLKWGELFPSIHQMRLVPGDSQSSILVDGIEYKGCVEIYEIRGKLHVVNEVDIERYLKATLSAAFDAELSNEVMDALAIVSRTNAYYLVSRKPEAHWHVDAQEFGYSGYAMGLQNLHVDRAIQSTRHMVLTHNGSPFASTWTKDSAGKTADFATLFRKNVSAPRGVTTPFAEKDRAKHAWSLTVSKSQLAKALGLTTVSAMDLYQDKASGKVYAVRVQDANETQNIDFLKLQKALGASRLRSSDFSVKTEGNNIVFSGFGEGPGVGLCLYSASAMARTGSDAKKILSAFFPDTQLENMKTLSLQ